MSEPEQDKELEDAFAEFADKSEGQPEAEMPAGEPEATSEEPQEQFQATETDELTKYRQEVETWKHKYNSDLGRQNALQRKIEEQSQQLAELQTKSAVNPELNGDWEAVKEDYPDIAGAFDARLASLQAEHQQTLDALKGEIEPIQQRAQQQFLDSQLSTLSTAHNDWREVVQSSDYQNWLISQPGAVQDLMGSQSADDNIYLLNTFKSSQSMQGNALQNRRQKQLQQAQTVPNRTSRAKTSAVADDDYDAAFEFYSKKR